MNRKSIMIIASVLAVILLGYATFAGVPENAGYEAFKDVIKDKQSFEKNSGSVEMNLEIVDNGKVVIELKGKFSGNHIVDEMSGRFNILTGNFEKEILVYSKDGLIQVYDVENNDVYIGTKVHDKTSDRRHKFDEERKFHNNSEAFLDFFIGDLKKEFNLISNSEGSIIELDITKDEMPALINILASVKSEDKFENKKWKEDTNLSEYPLFKEIQEAHLEVAKLVEEVNIEHINIQFYLNEEKVVTGVSFVLEITGLDENSNEHLIIVKNNMKFLENNDVVIEEINLEGKNIIEIENFNHMND